MTKTQTDSGKWVLPELGSDWVFDLSDVYMVINPFLSNSRRLVFYTENFDLTKDYALVGYRSKSDILKDIHFLNDGLVCVAVPLTRTALGILRASRKSGNYDAFSSIWVCDLPARI